MTSSEFLQYLHDHPATAELAGSLSEIVDTRRALAARRAAAAPAEQVGALRAAS